MRSLRSRSAVGGRWRGEGSAALLLLTPLLLALGGCGAGPGGDSDPGPPGARGLGGGEALRELERLAFLPRTEFVLVVPVLSRSGDVVSEGRAFELPRPVLLERFEVTRGQWLAYQAQAGPPAPGLARALAGWAEGTESWPASFVTRTEAEAFARWRGMRLATVDEWIHAAIGPSRWAYPWGTTFRYSVANTLELGLGRPTPVGTFEAGRTPTDCHDLLGNVYEWVAGAVPSPARGRGDGRGSAIGGSFRSRVVSAGRMIYDVRVASSAFPLSLELHPESRSDDVGLRCAVDAEAYLERRASEWGSDERALERLRGVGQRFGRASLPLLNELSERPGLGPDASAALAALAEGARR